MIWKPKSKVSKDIVLVNTSDITYSQISLLTGLISDFDPRVIGLDHMIPKLPEDYPLETIDFNNLVLPCILEPNIEHGVNQKCSESISTNSIDHYGDVTIHSLSSFNPYFDDRDHILSFSSQLIRLYDSKLFETLMSRENSFEYINYVGNTRDFTTVLNIMETSNEELDDLIKDKIVVVGYLGTKSFHPTDPNNEKSDVHYTPLGSMFGTAVLANILHTILTNDYINQLNYASNIALVILISFAFIPIMKKIKFTYNGYFKVKIYIVLLILFMAFLCHVCITYFNFAINFQFITIAFLVNCEVLFLSKYFLD
ncbi:MAG: CHASE2 domain-containing protein [Cyclobacteriaceae bacterium]